MTKSNPELLKVQLRIKHQLKYLEKCYNEVKTKHPDNKVAQNQWLDMVEATQICLQIAYGQEL